MAKLTLRSDPTFLATVQIPVPGTYPEPVKFTFKHRSKDELRAFMKAQDDADPKMEDIDLVMSMAEGWDLDDPFNRENVDRLLQKFHAAATAISTSYIRELTQARLGN
jgi:hypothetical protein